MKCINCNIEKEEDTNLHTDMVGGASFKEQIYLDYRDEEHGSRTLFGNKKISKRRVKARVCPKCGKVEFYIDMNK